MISSWPLGGVGRGMSSYTSEDPSLGMETMTWDLRSFEEVNAVDYTRPRGRVFMLQHPSGKGAYFTGRRLGLGAAT